MKKIEIDKSQVALRFAQAGQSYSKHAVVQKQIAQQLFDLIVKYAFPPFDGVLEIGCGSGNLSHLLIENLNINHLVLNDLYANVQQHFSENKNIQWLMGDIEQLEFPQGLDLITSSSALQWIDDLDAVFQKVFESLKAHAYFCFSTFGPQNLQEIKSLTGQGLDYLSLENIQEKLYSHNFEILHISEQINQLDFQHPKQILQHLKATGVTATASNFRWTKQSLANFYQAYQQFCKPQLLSPAQPDHPLYPLTYHPIYCIARRRL